MIQTAYRTVHSRIVRHRGPASAHACAAGCGKPARDWAFDNQEPSWSSSNGAYYGDIHRYDPLCRSCHEMKDKGDFCKNGHRWSDGNRYIRKDQGTVCRACRRENMRRYYRREAGLES